MFQLFYEAYQRRIITEELTLRKNMQIAGLWANTNLDQKEVNRGQIIESLEESYKDVINKIYGHKTPEELIDFNADPFFAAGMKGLPPEPTKSDASQPEPQQKELQDYEDVDQD